MVAIAPPASLHSGSYVSTPLRLAGGSLKQVNVPLYDAPRPSAGHEGRLHRPETVQKSSEQAQRRLERSLLRQQKREMHRRGPDHSRRRQRWENGIRYGSGCRPDSRQTTWWVFRWCVCPARAT